MNSIRINRNLLKKFVFAHFVLLEDYEQGALRKETVMVTFIEWFIIANLGKSYWQIQLVIRAIYVTI